MPVAGCYAADACLRHVAAATLDTLAYGFRAAAALPRRRHRRRYAIDAAITRC